MYYVNYNKHGQNIGHNSLVPRNIQVDGSTVSFEGTMSEKTSDTIIAESLVSHHVTGKTPLKLYCQDEDAARRVAKLLRENPNYSRGI